MKNTQKGSVAVWVIIILVVVIIIGGVYWYLTQTSNQPAVSPVTQTQQDVNNNVNQSAQPEQQAPSPTTTQKAVVIDSISPTIVSHNQTPVTGGQVVTIYGSNFSSDSVVNLSQYGSVVVSAVTPVGLKFISPQQIILNNSGNIAPGVYQLSVSNSQGTSNSVDLTIKN